MQNNSRKKWKAVVAGAALTLMLGASATVRAEEHKTNACGCYQKLDGSCVCGRPSKCGCPGECEPKGCEEKRQKEIDKEIQAETKKAEDADRKRREEAAAKLKAEERAADDAESESGGAADGTGDLENFRVKENAWIPTGGLRPENKRPHRPRGRL